MADNAELLALREQVALRIGWTRRVRSDGYPPLFYAPAGRTDIVVQSPDLPNYPESLAACEAVLEWLTREGWTIYLECDGSDPVEWECWCGKTTDAFRSIEGRDSSLPKAICRAVVQIGATP